MKSRFTREWLHRADEACQDIYTGCKKASQKRKKKTARTVINFQYREKDELPRSSVGKSLWNYESTFLSNSSCFLVLTYFRSRSYSRAPLQIYYPVPPLHARIAHKFLQDSYCILPFSTTRVRIRYFLLSGSIFTVTLPLKAAPFTPARSIDDAKPIGDPRNRIFLSRLVRS